MSRFARLKAEKKIKFLQEEVSICKLSVSQVLQIQQLAKEAEESKSDLSNLQLMAHVIKSGVPELSEMTDEELFNLPMDDLSNLSTEIMKFSGLAGK